FTNKLHPKRIACGGNMSIDFGVKKVPESHKHSANGNRQNNSVKNPKKRTVRDNAFVIINHRKDNAYRCSLTQQSGNTNDCKYRAKPDTQNDFNCMVIVIMPAIEKYVNQACT